jgi:hypothetical protein
MASDNRLCRRLETFSPFSVPLLSVIWLASHAPSVFAQAQAGTVELGGLKSRAPASWVEERPNNARFYKEYRIEPVNDDKSNTRVTIEFLGKGRRDIPSGSIKRWKGMFLPAEGKTVQEAARVQRLTVNGAPVTYLDIRGDYKGIPGDDTTPQQNFRLLGVYLDTPQGWYQLRLFGPADTVEFHRTEFEDWAKAFK